MLKRISKVVIGLVAFAALGMSTVPANAGSFPNTKAGWEVATQEADAALKAMKAAK